MTIVDLNQVMISNYMTQIGNHTNIAVDENLFRHMVLNSIRSINKKFSQEYGDIVIACDSARSWRKEIFPYYKANRKKARENSELDWSAVFNSLNKVREELKEFFPYRVIQVEHAEADDIIGSLVDEFHGLPILIVSGDKDFVQLQCYMNVKQYDPVRKRFITHNNPAQFVREHIIKGDMGDGVPNFLSPDNSYVVGVRQKPIRSKKLSEWVSMEPEQFCDETMLRNYKRNQQLVDLQFVPKNIREETIRQYNAQSGKDRAKLFNYFVEHKLKNLMESIGDF
jgi:5'-3' exonuclease